MFSCIFFSSHRISSFPSVEIRFLRCHIPTTFLPKSNVHNRANRPFNWFTGPSIVVLCARERSLECWLQYDAPKQLNFLDESWWKNVFTFTSNVVTRTYHPGTNLHGILVVFLPGNFTRIYNPKRVYRYQEEIYIISGRRGWDSN